MYNRWDCSYGWRDERAVLLADFACELPYEYAGNSIEVELSFAMRDRC
jgi:hypothetical protein